MQTEQRSASSTSAQEHVVPPVQETPQIAEPGGDIEQRVPAKLPPHSRAAAAQRFNDVP
jgi:hypothetical protein